MTLLYRSPNVVIDRFEWHATVEVHFGRIRRKMLWRPLSTKPGMWQPIREWQGRKPLWKEFNRAFGPFKLHMTRAERSVVENGRLAREMAA